VTHEDLLSFYSRPGVFTGVDRFATQVDAIPNDVASVVLAVQGLLIHEGLASAYGVALPADRVGEKQLHSAGAMLDRAAHLDEIPLNAPRAPDKRVIGVCRHFATLFVAFMRHKRIPCRARCGFANYFEPGKHLDHWVGEYWQSSEQRWVLVDAQIDAVQHALFRVKLNTLDVPRDRFLVAGDAWRACRAGADAMNFGVAGTSMWGLTEVFGDVFQDLAALQNIELLPWGWYGMATDDKAMETEAELVDRLAMLSSRADAASIETLLKLVAADDRLRVPVETLTAILAAE
jgi:hypothetical protein